MDAEEAVNKYRDAEAIDSKSVFKMRRIAESQPLTTKAEYAPAPNIFAPKTVGDIFRTIQVYMQISRVSQNKFDCQNKDASIGFLFGVGTYDCGDGND